MRGSFWRKSIFALLARVTGVPVVFHLHGSEMKSFVDKQPELLRLFIGWILSKQSVVVVLSESWMNYVKSISPDAHIEVLPNYVGLPDIDGKVSDTKDGAVELLFLGLVGTRKGVYDLLPAFQVAIGQFPKIRLIIGGNGDIERARALIAELCIEENVVLAGWVSGADKINLLRSSDIYVLPSYNEGLPVSLLEAMSWQVPVISTRVGGIPELVRDGVDGLLVEPGDQSGLASAILRLAEDVHLRREMGVAARARVELKYSKQVILPKLEDIYRTFSCKNH